MMLRLTIENVPSLTSGDPVELMLAEHGLVIGRAAHADWTLPDPANHVSSIHCEIDYRDNRYFLTDRSTNGTFINGAGERPSKPVQLRDGDLLQIGHYQVRVEEVPDGSSATSTGFGSGADPSGFGGGIDWGGGAAAAAQPINPQKFGREPARPLFQSSEDPLMAAFAAPAAQRADPFGMGGGAAPAASSGAPDPFGLSGAAAPPPMASPASFAPPATPDPFGMAAPPSTGNPFGMAGPSPAPDPFGMAASAPAPDPFGMAAPAAAAPDPFGMAAAPPPAAFATSSPSSPANTDPWATLSGSGAIDFSMRTAPPPPAPPAAPPAPVAVPVAAPPAAIVPPLPSTAAPTPVATDLYDKLLAATGLGRPDMGKATPESVVETIGQLLRQTADGLFRLLEARTRVRHQFGVGAQVTTFQRAGNNPLKWTRSPEQALKQMIGQPDPGFLDGAQAVRGAFEDLQAHEMAMIAAMQEAMQATIKRFAPDSIRARISAKGWLKSVLPGSREATLWRAYESEFSAFADESEAAYLDLFAKQFKKAYERIVSEASQG